MFNTQTLQLFTLSHGISVFSLLNLSLKFRIHSIKIDNLPLDIVENELIDQIESDYLLEEAKPQQLNLSDCTKYRCDLK